jgi:hypothetical protein
LNDKRHPDEVAEADVLVAPNKKLLDHFPFMRSCKSSISQCKKESPNQKGSHASAIHALR